MTIEYRSRVFSEKHCQDAMQCVGGVTGVPKSQKVTAERSTHLGCYPRLAIASARMNQVMHGTLGRGLARQDIGLRFMLSNPESTGRQRVP